MDAALIGLVQRLESIKPRGVEQETIYNFAFGAVFALASAELHGYPYQSSEPGRSKRRSNEVRKLAAQMATQEASPKEISGEWLSGFYFNDALFREYVCLEHLLKYLTKQKGKLPKLIKEALAGGFDVAIIAPDWKTLSKEVNNLKHVSENFAEGPTISYQDAVKIVVAIISAVEWVFKHADRN